MTVEIETTDTVVDDSLTLCNYCEAMSGDTVLVTIETVRNMTYDEAVISLRYNYLGLAQGPISEDMHNRAISYAANNYKYETQDRNVCPDCQKVCEWCSDSYVTPKPGDNTFDQNPSFGYNRLNWSHMDRLCRDCADESYTCDRCRQPVHGDYTYTLDDGYTYCEACYEDYSYYCEACEVTYSGDYHARECHSMPRRIRNYSYKPDPVFQSIVEVDGDLSDYQKLAATPFMGFELEIECMNDNINEALDIVESDFGTKAYCKEDGSLEYGFEIVTHPMTLEAHKRLIGWSFCRELTAIGCRSWNTSTCGLHVHISRSAFRSNTHLAMFQHLIINNDVEMSRLAGRSSDRWAAFHGVRKDIQKRIKGQAYPQRYEAVNTTNEDTIEIRMFRGSLKAERILMALELVDAAFHYTKHMGTHDYLQTDRAHFYHFAMWVKGNEKYQNLNYYIEHYNLTANLPARLAQVESN